METRQFGKTDMQVSVLGFGGSEIRGAEPSNVEQVLNTALDGGINVIDTAACYGNSEDLIGRAVSSRRNDYFLFTKCGHAVGEDLPDLPDWDPRLIEASIERSLRRLRTDHVDLLQLHSCSIEVLRRGDVIKVLEKAKREGKTRYIGYSGDNENARYAINTEAFDTLQTSISIADQQGIDFTVPKANERSMGLIAKRPIANSAWLFKTMEKDAYGYTYWERLQILDYDFLKGSANESVARALRFTLSVPGVDVAIVGTTNPDHIKDNIEMVSSSILSEEDFNTIRAVWQERSDAHWLTQG